VPELLVLEQLVVLQQQAAWVLGGHAPRLAAAPPASDMLKGPGQAIGALQPVRRAAPAVGG
jgi:hypothetical protein